MNNPFKVTKSCDGCKKSRTLESEDQKQIDRFIKKDKCKCGHLGERDEDW